MSTSEQQANRRDDGKKALSKLNGRDVNEDTVIGGADDVYRERPTDDLHDSDLVDAAPLHEEGQEELDTPNGHDLDSESNTPSDIVEENIRISNLEDSADNID